MSTQAIAQTAQTVAPSRPDFGSGRYSGLMETVYDDSQVIFRITKEQAEKLARQVASEVGAIMRNAQVDVKTGKASKDGKITLSEAAKMKGVSMTFALTSLKALHFAAEAGKNGFLWAKTQWEVSASLREYFDNLK